MALPKGKLLTLVVVFAAIGLVTATGAFTTVTATRTATVSVSGDASALLAMGPYDGPNGDGSADASGLMSSATSSSGYAQISDNGELEISITGFDSNIQGSGVNYDATTDLKRVFVLENQGSQNVNVSITDADGDNGDDDQYVTFYNASAADHDGSAGEPDGLEGNNVTLAPGDNVVVSIVIETPDKGSIEDDSNAVNGRELIDAITVEAVATDESATFQS